ncbi:MAG TPA: hypothetical protein VJY84_00885, partial [Candidatus Saccharimonadales bacterium]|nr:hypothetical protein [Candidatus Saccharimonadales bacterium]
IVALDKDRGVFVKRANSTSDTLLGVISAKPAVHLGGFNGAQFADERRVAVALSGRIPVKVTTEGGQISIGDRITLSSTPGIGMKAGLPDQVVGIALENFAGGEGVTGEILVFVNLARGSGADLQGGNPAIDSLIVSGQLTTVDLAVSGNATIEGTLTLAGHLITAGTAPIVTAQTAAGTSAAVTTDGNDQAGTITITTGSNPTVGGLAKVVFNKPYGKTPKVILTAANAAATDLKYFYNSTISNFSLHTTAAPAAGTTYVFSYFIVQ